MRVDPADYEAVFDEVARLEELGRIEDATQLLERMLSSDTPPQRAREAAWRWIAQWGAPPDKSFAFAIAVTEKFPDDASAWDALEQAAQRLGQPHLVEVARQRATEIRARD